MFGITITDGAFGCGDTLAKRPSDVLDYRYLGEEALIKAVQRYRLPEAMPTNMFELELPSWKRLLENPRIYRIAIQAAMCDIAEGGVGSNSRGSHFERIELDASGTPDSDRAVEAPVGVGGRRSCSVGVREVHAGMRTS